MKASLVVTAHNEGALIGRTIDSVLRAVEFWQESSDEDFEFIVQVDSGTKDTKDYLRRFEDDRRFRILTSDFKDVGPARNFAAKKARGEYVFFIDGDDLISRGYIAKTLEILEKSPKEIVVCPEYSIGFSEDGKAGSILRMEDSKSKEHDAFLLFNINLWIMAIAGRRETFLKHPYIQSVNGYGHEDYAMNIALTGAGIKHKVAPGEIYFYREKTRSRRSWNTERRATEPYSELFEPDFWRAEVARSKKSEASSNSRLSKLKQVYLAVERIKLLKRPAEWVRGMLSKKLVRELPETVAREWEKIAELEPMASRKLKRRLNAMGIRGVNPYCPASMAYLEICQEASDFSGIDFKKWAENLNEEQRDLLLSRIMVQARGKATFDNDKYLQEWKQHHRELAAVLGL